MRINDAMSQLTQARNTGLPLSEVRAGRDATGALSPPNVATVTEALAAVIPAGVVGLYTLIVIPFQQFALKVATEDKAATSAALAARDKTTSEIQQQLAKGAQEATDLLWLRWGLVAFTAIVVLAIAIRAVRDGNRATSHRRRLPLAEPLTAVIAFLGWALATPGTPLAAQVPAAQLTIATTTIAGVAALLLLGMGTTLLTKSAPKARDVQPHS